MNLAPEVQLWRIVPKPRVHQLQPPHRSCVTLIVPPRFTLGRQTGALLGPDCAGPDHHTAFIQPTSVTQSTIGYTEGYLEKLFQLGTLQMMNTKKQLLPTSDFGSWIVSSCQNNLT